MVVLLLPSRINTVNTGWIRLYFKDGMNDPSIVEYFAEDIEDVREMTISKIITIEYASVDLNSDGLLDRVVIIASSLHSGSAGDTVYIYINENDSMFKLVGNYSFQVHYQYESCFKKGTDLISPFFVSQQQKNGYKNIAVNFVV